jgi:hypothetical protein
MPSVCVRAKCTASASMRLLSRRAPRRGQVWLVLLESGNSWLGPKVHGIADRTTELSFLYQAASWKTARRVVAQVGGHFGDLFPRVGFIVTNLAADSER